MAKFLVYKGEDWLGTVIAVDEAEARMIAEKNPDFAGFTHVEEKSEVQHEPHGA